MTQSENECREAFEMAFKESMPLTPGFGRQYLYDEAHFAWQGWQAAWNARSQDAEDARRYRWIRDMRCCMFSLSMNQGHAVNYIPLDKWIDVAKECYEDVPSDVLQRMKDSGIDWELQVYPDTPIGFQLWHGSTLDETIDQAIDAAMSK